MNKTLAQNLKNYVHILKKCWYISIQRKKKETIESKTKENLDRVNDLKKELRNFKAQTTN